MLQWIWVSDFAYRLKESNLIDNITPFEFLCIFILAVILIKPKEYRGIYLRLGKLLHKLRSSELWKTGIDMVRDIRNLPNQMDREAGTDESSDLFAEQILTRATNLVSKPGDENNHE